MNSFYNLILAGGSGKRLAPLSQEDSPKQFLKIGNTYSFFQQTILRNLDLFGVHNIYISSKPRYKKIIEEQIFELMELEGYPVADQIQIILEPGTVNNTASAISFAKDYLMEEGITGSDFLFITPSDHFIRDTKTYHHEIKRAKAEIQFKEHKNHIFLFGIPSQYPDEKYGYIKTQNNHRLTFEQFIEKPSMKTLEKMSYIPQTQTNSHSQYLWFWNSGIFMISIDLLTTLFEGIRYSSISFDRLILENLKPKEAQVFSLSCTGWLDIGSWENLQEYLERHNKPVKPVVVTKPWGCYLVLDKGEGYKVKKLIISTGKKISKQFHRHRLENWTVVKGAAKTTVDDHKKYLLEKQSVTVPQQTIHQLENVGRIPLEVIEVQCGEYLEEDDIVRLED